MKVEPVSGHEKTGIIKHVSADAQLAAHNLK
jgi:hypothetical protein